MLPVALLAGGLATRLGAFAASTPKALLTVAGRPFIFHQLAMLERENVEHVVLCIGHLGESIQAAVGDGARFGLRIDYSRDGERLLGTGGAIKNALPLLGEAFFVLYGDSYLSCSFAAVQKAFENSRRRGLLTVLRNENRWEPSNVRFADGQVIEYDKRAYGSNFSYIDYGLSILTREAFGDRAAGESFDLGEVVRELAGTRQLAGFEVSERFYEIGSLQGLKDTEARLSQRRPRI